MRVAGSLLYEINHKRERRHVLLEVEGTGGEIAELERRMRVNDQILRYMTIRVDEDRRRAEKLKGRRARKAARRGRREKRKQLRAESENEMEDEYAPSDGRFERKN